MMAGLPASYFCVRAFARTDLVEELKSSPGAGSPVIGV
jgi:hypothetical protein